MSRAKQVLLLVGGLAVVAAVLYWAYRAPPPSRPEPTEVSALAWLPAESGLVAGIRVAELRQQAWVFELSHQATGEVEQSADYQAFVQATGFDYTRDLEAVWLGVFGDSRKPTVVGVAAGRFDRRKILAHASRQGATRTRHHGFNLYEVRTEFRPPAIEGQPPPEKRVGRFAFSFLDDTHLAFATDSAAAAMVVDCWRGQASSVAADEPRRALLEQWAAGRQGWAVDDLARWEPEALRKQQALRAVIDQISLAVEVKADGVEAAAAARCRDPAAAQRLRDNLRLLALAGRVALSRQDDQTSRALGQALGNLELTYQERTVQARVALSPELLATLLGVPPPVPTEQTVPAQD